MKPALRTREFSSTLQGERVGMSIDESALAHIMSVLTDLYSDPEMAVVREYATNAIDAHIEAGVTLPIEVTLPSTLSPYLKIRDYGNGLDIEDIREIYSRYGTSTKRDTNDLVGTLGLGCKSALTYTDQFTLQGIKNGVATQVAVSRDESGAGSMTIVTTYETDEASGVEISIPVKSSNNFEVCARRFFRFWEQGTVLVNGQEPEQITGIELAPGILAVDRDTLDGYGHDSVIVMGNVPYPFSDFRYDWQNLSVVAYVGIGDVQFTPSREALQMTEQTKSVIQNIRTVVKEGIVGAAQRIVNETTSKPEALQSALHARHLFNYKGELLYNDEVIPDHLILAPIEEEYKSDDGELRTRVIKRPQFNVIRIKHSRYARGNRSQENVLPTSVISKSVFLTGYTNVAVAPTHIQRLDQWWEDNSHSLGLGLDPEQFVLVEDLPLSEWIDPARIQSWEEVKLVKIERATNRNGRPAGSYQAIVPGQTYTQTITADQIDPSQGVFYYPYKGSLDPQVRKILVERYPKAVFVELMDNRVGKFCRMFPDARKAREAACDIAQAWFNKLSKENRMWLVLQDAKRRANAYIFERLDATKIEDPEFALAITQYAEKRPKIWQRAQKYRGLYSMPEFDLADPLQRYPMLEPIGKYYRNEEELTTLLAHAYVYVNAMYRTSQEATN